MLQTPRRVMIAILRTVRSKRYPLYSRHTISIIKRWVRCLTELSVQGTVLSFKSLHTVAPSTIAGPTGLHVRTQRILAAMATLRCTPLSDH